MPARNYQRGEISLAWIKPLISNISRLTKTLSKVSDKLLRMESHLNDFTDNHDHDHASVINKKWEEHDPTVFSRDPPKVSINTEGDSSSSSVATVDRLNQQIDVVDQDLSNGNINENKSQHVDTTTIGNYIPLDNDVVAKLSEIVETFREDSGTSLNEEQKITEPGDQEKVFICTFFYLF